MAITRWASESPTIAPIKLLVGFLLVIAVLGIDSTVALGSATAGVLVWLWHSRNLGPAPLWTFRLGSALGGVLCEVGRSLPDVSFYFLDDLGYAAASGMESGFFVGVGLSLLVSGARTWQRRSVAPAALLATFVFLLAASMPYGGCGKDKAYIAAMKSDLRNLATAQEAFFADQQKYARYITDLDYLQSTGVSVEMVNATRLGWYATASHSGVEKTCSIYLGKGLSETDSEAGMPVCG